MQLDIDALYYRLDLLQAEREARDFKVEWEEIKRQIQENRRYDTDEFKNPLSMLRDRLDKHFDYGELGQLAFNLNVDLEKVTSFNANKQDLMVNLIEYFRNRERLDVLVKAAHELRPDIERPFIEFLGVV